MRGTTEDHVRTTYAKNHARKMRAFEMHHYARRAGQNMAGTSMKTIPSGSTSRPRQPFRQAQQLRGRLRTHFSTPTQPVWRNGKA